MSDQLLPGPVRRQRAQEAREAVEEAQAEAARHPWRHMTPEARTALLAVVLMTVGGVLLVVTTVVLVSLLTGSVGIGFAAGGVVGGLTLFIIGILLGLNS